MQSTIESCDLEPIHALGLIQGHGALVAFDRGALVVARSTNATSLLRHVPDVGMRMADVHFDETARDAIAWALEHPEQAAAASRQTKKLLRQVSALGRSTATITARLEWRLRAEPV